MSEIKETKTIYLLWSTLAGAISFFASAVITSMVLSPLDSVIIDTILAGGIGGLFLGLFHINRHKIQKMGLAGLVAIPVGFGGAFILAGGADLLFSAINVNTENPNIHTIENIIGIIFMGIICGGIFGAILYGRKSIWTFSAVCGLVSFPFGILVGFFNSGHPVRAAIEDLFAAFGPIDLNFLAIITSFGIGIGLSIGLFGMLKQKSTEKGTM